MKLFGKPPRLAACDCERSDETNLMQSLVFLGDDEFEAALGEGSRVDDWSNSKQQGTEIVAQAYWAILSRPASEAERERLGKMIDTAENRRAAIADLAWTLVNAKEFLFRH